MALREVLADLVVRVRGAAQLQQVNRGVTGAVGSLRAAGRALGPIGAAISSALAIREVATFVREIVALGDELGEAAQRVGMNAEALSRWRYVAERSGIAAEQLQLAMQTMQRGAADAARGAGAGAAAFRQLHVQLRDGAGQMRANDAIFEDTIAALAGIESGSERAAIASRVFGTRAGAAIAALAAQGGPALEALQRRFDEISGGSMGQLAEQAGAADDAFTDWELVMTSLKAQLATSFLPTLTRLVSTMVEWSGALAVVLRRSNAFRVAMGFLIVAAGALAFALSPLVIILGVLIAPFALLFLAIEDVVTAFEGGQSVIGAFIDSLFGVGTTQAVVEGLTMAWQDFVELLERAAELLGITDGAGPPRRSAASRVRAATESKDETAPGARRRGPGRPPGAAAAQMDPREYMARFGRLPVAGFTPSTSVPASALGAGATAAPTQVSQRFDNRFAITVNGAGEPEAVAAAIRAGVDDRQAAAVRRAAGNLPQARRPT